MLLRASLRWLADVDATWSAIQILSLATPHPDVFWTEDNILPHETIDRVQATYRWSLEEAELLLGAPTGEMWRRGDLDQSVYMLLVADPDHGRLLREVIARTADDELAWAATMILVSLAGEDGLVVLDKLIASSLVLRTDQMVAKRLSTTGTSHSSRRAFPSAQHGLAGGSGAARADRGID